MFKKFYNHFSKDHLYRSSIYVMSSTFVMAVLGFLFWIIIARFFRAEYVGIATTLISVQTLLGLFSNLGLNMSLIRYLPLSKKRNDIISSSLIVTAFSSVFIAAVFLIGLRVFSPPLLFLQSNTFYLLSFIFFMIFATWNTVIESIFLAYRASGNILLKNTILSILKLIMPMLFISLGAYGIFTSVSMSIVISSLVALVILIRFYSFSPQFVVNQTVIAEMTNFSVGNYITGILYQLPSLVMPLLIVNFLPTKDAAYYYIASMILNFLIIIPMASTQALLAEGSYDAKTLNTHIQKAIKMIIIFLIPAVLLFVFFGNLILHFFGKDYEREAFHLVQLLSLSSIFTSIILLGSAVLRVKQKIMLLIKLNFALCISVLVCSYLFISYGLVGIGFGWLLGQILASLLFLKFLR